MSSVCEEKDKGGFCASTFSNVLVEAGCVLVEASCGVFVVVFVLFLLSAHRLICYKEKQFTCIHYKQVGKEKEKQKEKNLSLKKPTVITKEKRKTVITCP